MIKRVDKRLQAVQCLTGNKIKIIACITMLIDHFSKIFLESIMNDKLFPLYLAGGMSTVILLIAVGRFLLYQKSKTVYWRNVSFRSNLRSAI